MLDLNLDLDLDLDFIQVNRLSDSESRNIIEHHQCVLQLRVFRECVGSSSQCKCANCSEMFAFNYKKKRRQIEILFAFNMLCK